MPFDHSAWARERREQRVRDRMCTRCGVALADDDGLMCRVHAAIHSEQTARSHRKNYSKPRDIESRLSRIKSRWGTLRYLRRSYESTHSQGVLADDAADMLMTTVRRPFAPIAYGEADTSIPCMSAPASRGERPARVSLVGRSPDGSTLTFEVAP